MTPKTRKTVSLAVAALGLALLGMMVAAKGEPGGLALALGLVVWELLVMEFRGCAGGAWD